MRASAHQPAAPAAVLAVDGGNSKADVALVAADGRLLAAVRGPTISHQAVGLGPGAERLTALAGRAATAAGIDPRARPIAEVAAYCVAGADFPAHERQLHGTYSALGIARRTIVHNDAFAPLRAGTEAGVGVAIICGAGMNCLGVRADGRRVRFPALGDISGDWGGGGALGSAALAAAVRARDGRGPRTLLETVVPAHFGLARPLSVTVALDAGRLRGSRLRELAPVLFEAAARGDAVARSIVDRQADEIVAMATATLRRLGMLRAPVRVVLAGGISRTEEAGFWDRMRGDLARAAPRAELVRLEAPPVLGAALFGLDALLADDPDARAAAETRIRAELTEAAIAAA